MEQQAIHGLILSGGQSSRMGTDKALLPIKGKPLLQHLALQLLSLVETVTISVGDPQREQVYRAQLGDLAQRVSFVTDQYPGCGPLSGLHAGLSAIEEGYVFVVACDMPELSPPLFRQLLSRIDSGAAVIHTPRQPFHALYHTRAASCVQAAIESQDYRLMGLLERLCAIEVEPLEADGSSPFSNLNTPEDYSNYIAE